jgi:hypothetical protein
MKRLTALTYLGFVFTLCAGEPALLTFDELPFVGQAPPPPYHAYIPDGYGGLSWPNFKVTDGTQFEAEYGYRTGIVSSNNVIFNAFGDPGAIAALTSFDLHSAYLTSGVISNMGVRVQAYVGQVLKYDDTYQVNTKGPVFIEFNYAGVDIVTFTSVPPPPWGPHPVVLDNVLVSVNRDGDGDGVLDEQDNCPGTGAGEIVNDRGCSIAQLVPCDGAWRSHGEYVRAVTTAANEFVAGGFVTSSQRDIIVREARRSDCGKR